MRLGFAKTDITPRVGVELCGFGPYINRHSVDVCDSLWSRAMAVECEGQVFVLISNDLVHLNRAETTQVRALVGEATGLGPEAVMVHCTHTHSGPSTGTISGWGEQDPPYLAVLPGRIAAAALGALDSLQEATLAHAEVPCEGMALNREYDRDAPPLDEVLQDSWRPAHPELTDTTCHVLVARGTAPGRPILGFASYFGCHPVVCCAACRSIHGDYPGVATNLLEAEVGGVGLFLQGAQGDVNTCVVHKPAEESLRALDVIAERYARAVRAGLAAAADLPVGALRVARREVTFSRRQIDRETIQQRLAEQEAILRRPGASDASGEVGMAVIFARAFREMLRRLDNGDSLEPASELHGLRLGPLALLAAPLEIFQAIKNEVKAQARAPIPLVMGLTNDQLGYAPDRTVAARGGYAADNVPLILGAAPFAAIHDELVRELLALDAQLSL